MRRENGRNIYSVKDVNTYVKNIITQDYLLRSVCLEGEISQCKQSAGNLYLTLKDCTGENEAGYDPVYDGVLKINVWRRTAGRLEETFAQGDVVIVTGRADIYAPQGSFSVSAATIRKKTQTVGWHDAAYLETRRRLAAEGLFAPEAKKKLPVFPRTVGVVGSLDSRGYEDLTVNGRAHNPYIQIVACDSRVQGPNAVPMLVQAIRKLDQMGLDVIAIVRGGGAREDLCAFDDERVVRAIYEARTPIVAGTGHEGDFSLADEAADYRASTPTAVADKIFPDARDIKNNLDYRERELAQFMSNKCREKKQKLDASLREMRLHMQAKFTQKQGQITLYAQRIQAGSPQAKLERHKELLESKAEMLASRMKNCLNEKKHRCQILTATLHGNSPTAKLVGGFGYLEAEGKPLLSASQTGKGEKLRICLSDGEVRATVDDVIVTQ